MQLVLSEEQQGFAEDVRKFADEIIAPVAHQIDKTRMIPDEVIKNMVEKGYLGALVPKEFGGMGLDGISYALLIEEISRACAATGFTLAVHTTTATMPILNFGTGEQKKKYLPGLCKGMGAFSLTEPGAGSDPGSASTEARREGDEWVISGRKRYTTNGIRAGTITLMAVTENADGKKGASAFILERGQKGLRFGKREELMGICGSEVVELIVEDCRVPGENLLGNVNDGMKIALNSLDFGRVGIAAQAVGIGQAALDAALSHAKSREQFGRPIAKFQAIQWMLADTATELEAARLLTYESASLMAEGGNDLSYAAARAKLFASKTAKVAADRAVQIHGGGGYVKGSKVERLYRDAKITEIYEGTSEIMRLVMTRSLLK